MRTRAGVTPVVGTLLLVMMTVAAAGGAYMWYQEITADVQQQVTTGLETQFGVKNLECLVNASGTGHDRIVLGLKNEGSQPVAGREVDVFADVQTNLNVTVTDLNWSTQAFVEPGGFDIVTVNVSESIKSRFLVPGQFYDIEIDFSSPSMTVDIGVCMARRDR